MDVDMNQVSKSLAWASDIHFEFATSDKMNHFYEEVNKSSSTHLLIAGDTSVGQEEKIVTTIKEIQKNIDCPLFFICGNHDFYGSSFEKVRTAIAKDSTTSPLYVHKTSGIKLTPKTALAAHDGWCDGRSGTFFNSTIALNDFFYIEDFNVKQVEDIFTEQIFHQLNHLGNDSAAYAKDTLPNLFKEYQNVIFLTHVPPFRESSWYNGKIGDDGGAPFFVNQALGNALKEIMEEHPENNLTVLCGHTHHEARYQPLENLLVLTADAEYGNPRVQESVLV